MKNECDIVKDLLFSYNDNVLSKNSKEFVDEHLKKCEKCKSVLEEIKKEDDKKVQMEEIDFFKRIKKKINKKNIIICIGIIVLVLLVLFNILVFKNYNNIASTMEIYMQDNVTEEQREKIKDKIIELCDNVEIEYVSKEKALERMKSKIGEKSNLLDGYNNENNIFPTSFEIKTNTNIQKVVNGIQEMPGIKKIVTHQQNNPYILFFTKNDIK